MWDVKFIEKQGSKHKEYNLQCQDKTAYREHEDVQVIALSDASGADDFARLGALTTSQTAADLLAYNYHELCHMDTEKIRYNLITNIRDNLYDLCEIHDLELSQLKSTVLVMAIDTRNETFLMAHLGDGYIGGKIQEKRKILSYPENGVNKAYTKMTTQIPAADSIRIKKGTTKMLDEIFLISDGCEDLAAILDTTADLVAAGEKIKNHRDDMSIIRLKRLKM